MRRLSTFLLLYAGLLAGPGAASTRRHRSSLERVTFDEAVRRALEKNPTVAEAATAILRAEGLLQQAQAATRPTVTGNVSNGLLNSAQGFDGTVFQPRDQVFFSANLGAPVLAASQWAAAARRAIRSRSRVCRAPMCAGNCHRRCPGVPRSDHSGAPGRGQ